VVEITAAPTDEQHFRVLAFEFANSLLPVPHPVVVTNGPTWEAGIGVGMIGPSLCPVLIAL